MEGFRLALANKVQSVELDVWLTKDK